MREALIHHRVTNAGLTYKPTGKALFTECALAVNEALSKASPALADRQDLFFKQVEFGDFEDIQEAERKDRSSENQRILFNRFILAGVPRDVMEARYSTVSEEYCMYLNPEQPRFMLPTGALHQFSAEDERERFRIVRGFGQVLIYQTLKALPYLDNPYYDGRLQFMEARWRAIFLDDFRQDWEGLKERYKNKDNKKSFNEVEKKLFRLLTTNDPIRKPRFIPVGAMVAMVLPGQTLAGSEYLIGRNFNEGTIGHIAALVEPRYLQLMKDRKLLPPSKEAPSKVPKSQIVSEREHRLIGLGNDQDLIREYLESGIAIRHIQTEDNPKVNIWCYPPEQIV